MFPVVLFFSSFHSDGSMLSTSTFEQLWKPNNGNIDDTVDGAFFWPDGAVGGTLRIALRRVGSLLGGIYTESVPSLCGILHSSPFPIVPISVSGEINVLRLPVVINRANQHNIRQVGLPRLSCVVFGNGCRGQRLLLSPERGITPVSVRVSLGQGKSVPYVSHTVQGRIPIQTA